MKGEPFSERDFQRRFFYDSLTFPNAGIISPKILPFDTPLKIAIQVEDGPALTLEGEIAWCKKSQRRLAGRDVVSQHNVCKHQ